MHGNLLDIFDDGIDFLILVFLEEAEEEVQHEQELDEVVCQVGGKVVVTAKGSDVRLCECVVGACNQHYAVERSFPGTVDLDHESVDNRIVHGLRQVGLMIFIQLHVVVQVFVDFTFFLDDLVVMDNNFLLR